MPADRPVVVYMIAGEPSGDLLGGRLIEGLRERAGRPVVVRGVGGPRMREAGLDPLFDLSEIAFMGVAEILPRLPGLLERIRRTADDVARVRPDVLVTIDAPDFVFRVARRVRPLGIPVVHYVAPTVWAWRPGRAARVARSVDHLMTLLPFEPEHFVRVGLPATFVGHSVVESGAGQGDGVRFRRAHGIGDEETVLTVLPGSRRGEVTRLLPIFGETVARLARRHSGLRVVVPTVPNVAQLVGPAVAAWPVPTLVVGGEAEKFDAFAASRAALACSGTVALELALAGLPAVVAYKVNPITAAIVRRLIRVPYVNLVNIMLGRMLVPELLQDDCTPERLEAAVGTLLSEGAARQAQIAGVRDVAAWLGAGGEAPSRRAAAVVLSVVADAVSRGR
ncbi:MAG: lipid-A-disaccharide synthase [Rhodospirillales bacterium]|jgi:lipid-A-disaccharide synthase